MNCNFSLSHRLVAGFGGAFILLTGVSAAILYYLLVHQLTTQRNAILADRLDASATLLKSPAHGLQDLRERIVSEWPLRGGEKVFVTVTDADGREILRTPGVRSDGGHQAQILERTQLFENSVGLASPVRVSVTIGDDEAEDFLGTLREVLFGVAICNIFVSLFVGWQVVRRGLAPLDSIAKQVARLDSQSLHERISTETLPIELRGLAQAFNHAIDRLTDSFEKLSRFSSDIAHELRTPVANIMGTVEVALSRAREEEDYREVLTSNLEECSRLSRICESLLFLARAESRRGPSTQVNQVIDLKTEFATMLEFYDGLASEKEIELSLVEPPADQSSLIFHAEPTLFQRAIGNLLSNAIRYTGKSGRIELSYRRDANRSLILEIRDNGIGISEKDLSRIFDRFYRVDPARHLSSDGTGLGLAIVKSIVDLHGGSIQVESRLAHSTCFTVHWPDQPELSQT